MTHMFYDHDCDLELLAVQLFALEQRVGHEMGS